MTATAALLAVLHRYTGRGDICVGTYTLGRNRSETELLIGKFLNNLVLRTDFQGDPTLIQLLGRVKEVTLDAFAHQDYPFLKLSDELPLDYDPRYTHPLTRIRCIHDSKPASFMRLAYAEGGGGTPSAGVTLPSGLELGVIEIDYDEPMDNDLILRANDDGEQIGLTLEYPSDWFDATTIDRLLSHLESVMGAFATDPQRRLSELPF
jgi:non-ribosomal peptide synthetase component F